MSNNKALALLVLLSMAAAAAGAAAALPQPTVFAALQVTPEVSDFWQTLSWFPDVAELLGGSFTGTVFAPNNKAWASVAHETRTGGLPLTTDALKAIILYHIAPGKPAFISDLVDDQVFVSALDKKFTAQYSDGVLHLQAIGSAAKVVTPDIAVGADSASVVHVIDTVLLPFKLETGSKPEGSVAATSIDTSTIEGAQAAASSAINAAGDSLNTALGSAQAALGSASGSVQDAASAAANAVQQAAAGAATSGQAAVGAANGAVTGAVGGAATAVTDTAGTMVDGAIGAVPGAVAGVGAPDAADVNALAAGPAAGPAAAPSPSAAPEPVSAPESVPVPVSSAATASCKYVVLAIVALAVMLV